MHPGGVPHIRGLRHPICDFYPAIPSIGAKADGKGKNIPIRIMSTPLDLVQAADSFAPIGLEDPHRRRGIRGLIRDFKGPVRDIRPSMRAITGLHLDPIIRSIPNQGGIPEIRGLGESCRQLGPGLATIGAVGDRVGQQITLGIGSGPDDGLHALPNLSPVRTHHRDSGSILYLK